MAAPPTDEARRLEALRRYQVLDSGPEVAFDDLTALAAYVWRAPISVVSLVDAERQWFKSTFGWHVRETPRAVSFAAHAITADGLFIVTDTHLDPRFAANPFVTGPPHVRFYAGVPLRTADGVAIGALGVMDRQPRDPTAIEEDALHALGRQVMAQLELRLRAQELAASGRRLRLVTEQSRVGFVIIGPDHRYTYANTAYCEMFDVDPSAILDRHVADVLGDAYEAYVRDRLDRAFAGERASYDLQRTRGGEAEYFTVRYEPALQDGRVTAVIVVVTDVTDARRATFAAYRLAAIVESSRDAIVGKDLDGVVTSWNRGAESMFGYTAAEMIGASIRRLVPPDRQDEEDATLAEIRAGRTVEHPHTIRVAKDGRRVAVSVVSSPVRNAEGAIIGASKIARDITAQTRAEDALREREEQLRIYAADSPAAVAMFDTEMRYVVASRRWIEDYQLTDRPIVGSSHYDLFPNLPERWRDIHRRCLAGAVEKCDEDRFVRDDASVVWIRWEIRPWHRADGSIGGIIIFADDITAQKQAAEALRAADERMRFALESAKIGIWDMDYETGVLTWSDAMKSQYGVDAATFGGTFEAFLERVHPEDRVGLLEAIGQARRTGGDFITHHRAQWPDGTIRQIDGAGRVLLGDARQPRRAVGIAMDVTERHALEAQYLQAQKMEAVGRLAGGIAHDFNNLLTAILGYCELAMDSLDPRDPLRSDIGEIQKAGTTAAGLTRQLLAFSRKQIIQPALLDLNVVVAEMQSMVRRMIGEDVEVALRLAPEPARVLADRAQIEQMLLNLVVNARDAMPSGGRLTIETATVQIDEHYASRHFDVTPGVYTAVTVTDTGGGMAPDVLAHLFEPFFTTKEVGKGTGLGLATVHGVVARAGGSVSVYSEIGKGTAFKVYLPRAAAEPAAPAAPGPVAAEAVRGKTVLLVEDSDELRSLTRRLLERHGYTVLTAADPADALRLADAPEPIDVLLTDVVMPGASGPELARDITERRPGLKVVYMSGYTAETIVHHGVLNPGVEFLHKPFTSAALTAKLRDVLDR